MKHRGPGNPWPGRKRKAAIELPTILPGNRIPPLPLSPSPSPSILLAHRFRLRLFNYAVDNDGKNETKNMQLTWIPKLSPMRIKKQNKRWKMFAFKSRLEYEYFCNHRVIYTF